MGKNIVMKASVEIFILAYPGVLFIGLLCG